MAYVISKKLILQLLHNNYFRYDWLVYQSACSAMPMQYMALALMSLPRIFLDISMYILYISACAGMSNSMVHVSVGARFARPINVCSLVNRLENFKYINGVHSGLIQKFLCYGMTGE